MYSDEYGFSEKDVGSYTYKGKDIRFFIYDENSWHPQKKEHFVLGVSFMPDAVAYEDIVLLLNSLQDKGVIKSVN